MERIIETVLEEEVKKSYLTYAMSVIVSRALPDVRDGLKPVQRRILYTMEELGVRSNTPYKKCARIVGDTLGKYHPHGDASVYEALVRMAQDFNMRYPLIDGQGNFGSIDGDPPAAMRYSEARLEKIAEEMLKDIDKNTVDFRPNFDNSLEEPTVLPSMLPNLLLNGATGIAVGMATNIPTHNIKEVADAISYYIDHRNCSVRDLMKFIKGPDFPTGAVVIANEEMFKAYETGDGKIVIRAKMKLEKLKNGKDAIVITEIPYQVRKSAIIERISDLVREGEIDEISDIRDESDRDGIRIVIELKRGINPKILINKLYKHTQLQETFSINMVALVNNEPKILSLKDLIKYYVDHRVEVIIRRTKFDLNKAEERLHIVEGLLIALNNIDRVISIIKSSESPSNARTNLMKEFKLTEVQANAILDMKLQKLTSIEVKDLKEEHKSLVGTIKDLKDILSNENRVFKIIKDDLKYLAEKYGDERRTTIEYGEIEEVEEKELVQKEDVTIILTNLGMIKRMPLSVYRSQRAGGRGVSATSTMEEDSIEHLVIANTHEELLIFTDKGKAYSLDVYKIPETSRVARGTNIRTLLNIGNEETIRSLVVFDKEAKGFITIISRKGMVKKVDVDEFKNIRSTGIIALSTESGDVLQDAVFTRGDDDIIIATTNGLALRTSEKNIRPMGRSARGVVGIRLRNDDYVIGLIKYSEDKEILVVTEKGYAKRVKMKEFSIKGRGGKGMIYFGVSEKTGKVVRTLSVSEDNDVVIITSKGMIIRMPANNISLMGRPARGIRAVNLKENDTVVDVEVLE
ncbi:MAG: DNA gyrase subunit A [Spirochaetia bacterium]|nr:DNA gyrase subunit A [Spirochaetota bacterium]MDW8112722.1 DNA gyrase subunit A [Spirochaetia bacterium]